ncbi:MAG TPA: ABC transporter ATP-binding protein [Chloroflexota bacterium]|nr:ABC transporter ATP-binding protein [Chloroflexota bacterium]HZU07706.1 ABC transporter ATP-binding protein [Chloroflexota bacterium]
MPTKPLLRIQNLSVSYGPIAAIRDVSLEVNPGEIVAVLGANGAGKTTLLRTISGLLRPRAGIIEFDGVDLTRLPSHAIAARGVAHVPEGRGILGRMTVLENLRMGAFTRRDGEVERDLEALYARFPILAERRHQLAALLSGGQQQLLAIARAWMARPKLMLLDEPSLGLAPLMVAEVFRMIAAVRERCAVLLVEQNTRAALRVADRGYVMELGRVILQGTARELLADERLVRAYLGRRSRAAPGGAA